MLDKHKSSYLFSWLQILAVWPDQSQSEDFAEIFIYEPGEKEVFPFLLGQIL